MQRAALLERNTELKEPKCFIIGYKQTCPSFVPEGATLFILLDDKQICLLT